MELRSGACKSECPQGFPGSWQAISALRWVRLCPRGLLERLPIGDLRWHQVKTSVFGGSPASWVFPVRTFLELFILTQVPPLPLRQIAEPHLADAHAFQCSDP